MIETTPDINTIKKTAGEFIKLMGVGAEIQANFDVEQNLLVLKIKTADFDDSGVLIGHGGEILFAIQHILGQILRKKAGAHFFFDCDVNSYKARQSEYLKELAREIANQVALSKKPVMLEPMRPYERRIIHMELAGRSDIITESIGEGLDRKIQIKPHP